jgi:hypothetical protein
MAVPRYRRGRHCMERYHKHFLASDLKDDYEDRNTVYAMYAIDHFNIVSCWRYKVGDTFVPLVFTLTSRTSRRRKTSPYIKAQPLLTYHSAIDEIRKLVEKYPNGYQGKMMRPFVPSMLILFLAILHVLPCLNSMK